MKENFTFKDMRDAYEAGQSQKSAEWDNDAKCVISAYDTEADEDFDSWFDKNYLAVMREK